MPQSLQFAHLTRLAKQKVKSSSRMESVASELIEFLAGWFQCQWGTYWQVDPRDRVLRALATWSEDSLPIQKLSYDTKSRALTMSEGTAGHVWRTGIPVCASDLVLEMCLPRSLDAREAGLVGGIWFPIRAGGTTYGVIELLGRHYWVNDQRLIDQLTLLGQELGEVLRSRVDANAL